jgi:hypothetical protein
MCIVKLIKILVLFFYMLYVLRVILFQILLNDCINSIYVIINDSV